MKNPARFAVLMGIILLLCVSCNSTKNADSFSDEQYDYALHLVLDQTQDNATSDLFKQFNEFNESMVPEQFYEIELRRNDIPGMDLLIREWSEEASLSILQIYGDFTDYVEVLKSRITFRNPKALFDEGDTSVSAYYRSLYINDVAQMISKTIGTMDFKYWRQAIIQYNAWASTRNRLYGENNELLAAETGYDELLNIFSFHFASLFFNHLAASESLIRTTPDLSMDPLEAQILGLV